jgi:hypothetical protein
MVSGVNSRMKRPAHQRIRRPCSHSFRVTDLQLVMNVWVGALRGGAMLETCGSAGKGRT